jgi:hypothetical protein
MRFLYSLSLYTVQVYSNLAGRHLYREGDSYMHKLLTHGRRESVCEEA